MEQENQNLTPQKPETNMAKNIIIVIIILAVVALIIGLVVKGVDSDNDQKPPVEQAKESQQNIVNEKINVLVGQVEMVEAGSFKMKIEAAKNKGLNQDMMVRVLVDSETDIFIQSIPRTLSSGKKIQKGPGELSDLKKGDTVTVKNFQTDLFGQKEFTVSSVSVKRIID
jgi:hypothetical protein